MRILFRFPQYFKSIGFCILGIAIGSVSGSLKARPNVVLIFADDLGYGDVGAFNPDCPFKTPRLDRMAEEGAMLTDFYVPTPYCAPSRATILTGRYPFRNSVVLNPAPDAGYNDVHLPLSEVTIAELLREGGYATAAYGKWHLGHRKKWLPRAQGFDEYYGILYSNDMFPVQVVENESVVEYPVVQSKLTQSYTDRTIDFISRKREQPFFVYLPLAMPHKPLAASDNFYTPDTPDNLYADVIAELDYSVGRILDHLSDLELDRNTLVLFTSDNGAFFGGSSGGLRGMKGRTWEGGLRVPLIAWMPGTVPAGVVNRQPAGTIDVLPTLCQLAGIGLPNDRIIDGKDILPLLKSGQADTPHEALFGMKGSRLSCIRSGKWKLHVLNPRSHSIFNLTLEEARERMKGRAPDGVAIIAPFEQPDPSQYPGISTGAEPEAMMLFDVESDPGEQTNLAERHPEVVARLKRMFDATNAQVPDFPPEKTDYLFKEPRDGARRPPLMRLIGGELRYDRVPDPQRHLLK